MNEKIAPLYYLASPYTHPDRNVMHLRAKLVTQTAVELLKHNIFVFAPIAYNAPWEEYNLPGNWEFWEKFDKAFVSRMDGVIVLELEGWKESTGVTAEIAYAKSLGLPVYYLTIEQVKNNDLKHIL